MSKDKTSERKKDHIKLAFESQTKQNDPRFFYEPITSESYSDIDLSSSFLGFSLQLPLWISSMTGGAVHAKKINKNLAKACEEFGLGMGLGSCRILFDNPKHYPDFQVKELMPNQPLFANLGIAQIEHLINQKNTKKINELVYNLAADGLIIHINPLQEWMQPEGDLIEQSIEKTLNIICAELECPIIVKEVGQGMGPSSLKKLLKLPIDAIDFGAFGGTNFAMLEYLRSNSEKEDFASLISLGHTAPQMVDFYNNILVEGYAPKPIIISGGIKDFLDGYYCIEKIKTQAIYGQASPFLKPAMQGYELLQAYINNQKEGLGLAKRFLTVK